MFSLLSFSLIEKFRLQPIVYLASDLRNSCEAFWVKIQSLNPLLLYYHAVCTPRCSTSHRIENQGPALSCQERSLITLHQSRNTSFSFWKNSFLKPISSQARPRNSRRAVRGEFRFPQYLQSTLRSLCYPQTDAASALSYIANKTPRPSPRRTNHITKRP